MKRTLLLIPVLFLFACKTKKEKVELKITEFIQEYAAKPKSYKPTSFSQFDYTLFVAKGRSEYDFIILHEYELTTKNGDVVDAKHFFKLSDEYQITRIEYPKSNIASSIPTNYGGWFNHFGRELSALDSSELNLISIKKSDFIKMLHKRSKEKK